MVKEKLWIININRVIDNNDINIYKCNYCKNLLNIPYECNKCKLNFCYFCLTKKIFNKCNCNENSNFNINLLMKHNIDNLIIKCKYNSYGCIFSDIFEKIKFHEKECVHKNHNLIDKIKEINLDEDKKNIIKCKYCKKILLKEDYLNHNIDCDQIIIFCDKCDSSFKKVEKKDHSSFKCLTIIFNNFKSKVSKKLNKNDKWLNLLECKILDQDKYFNSKCITCNKLICESSIKTCSYCNNIKCNECISYILCLICKNKKCDSCFNSKLINNCNICIKQLINNN